MPGEFKGKIELDIRDSTPDWDAFLPDRAPEGAPNVLVVLYDDTGLAAWSPFGGLVLDLGDSTDLDVETLDMLRELTDALAAEGIELRLASVRSQARELLARSGLAARVRMERTIDAALT